MKARVPGRARRTLTGAFATVAVAAGIALTTVTNAPPALADSGGGCNWGSNWNMCIHTGGSPGYVYSGGGWDGYGTESVELASCQYGDPDTCNYWDVVVVENENIPGPLDFSLPPHLKHYGYHYRLWGWLPDGTFVESPDQYVSW